MLSPLSLKILLKLAGLTLKTQHL
uniref:Uncharacterized protein n=1 Tax=Rhizophora mucronata TaxID=61149 RepID=A0A2P2IR67_RHIMU